MCGDLRHAQMFVSQPALAGDLAWCGLPVLH